MRGLNWQTFDVPFVGGLQQKNDPRSLEAPGLSRAVNVQFDELGGIQLRKPMTSLSATGLSDVRRVYATGDELFVFTKTELLSYTPSKTAAPWTSRGTHLAIKVEEETRFATTGDQFDPDRAELAGTVVYSWTEGALVYVAALDKTTGAVIMSPTSKTGTRARLVALTTKILLFYDNSGGSIVAHALDPAAPATGLALAATNVLATNANLYYDVVKIPSADSAFFAARRIVTTSYEIAKVTSALAVTASTKARVCDGPIAVSVDPTGATAQIFRSNVAAIQGDRITMSTLADAATAQAIGTVPGGSTVNQIAAAHRSVQNSGAYRCYAFWTADESIISSDWESRFNYVDTGGTIGTQATFIKHLGVSSRAFDYGGEVYFWGVFAGQSGFSGASPTEFRAQLQNTYFLYRDDASIQAKAAFDRGGGLSPSNGRLPNVALTSGTTTHSWAGTERRIIDIGTAQKGFDKRAPRDVTFTFDSNEARRIAKLGRTVYVSGGAILQYDGVRLVECGFAVYPWYFAAAEVAAGNLADGTYAYKVTWKYDNAKGEVDRSTTATVGTVAIAAGPNGVSIVAWKPLYTTRKTTPTIVVEAWRTAVDPTADSPFYLVTSKDPTATSNPNRYIVNDPTAYTLPTFNDEFADATLITKESHPENGSVLESLAPPAASIIISTDTRLFLAGVAGDPDRVIYSKLRNDGEIATWHDALAIDVPRAGGDITALAVHGPEDELVVFRERAIYALPGDGFDNLGAGQNYGPARTIATDVGAISHETVARTPLGTIFKSSKGWYVLRDGVEYIGGPVSDYDSETVLSVHVVESQHQVRILSASRTLVWDYLAPGQPWAEWSVAGVHSCMWNGVWTVAATTALVQTQATTYSGVDYALDVETAWIKLGGLQGYGAVRWFELLGEYRADFVMKFRVARNYKDYVAFSPGQEAKDFNPTQLGLAAGDPLQMRHTPRNSSGIESIKVRLTTFGTSAAAATLATDVGANWDTGGTVTTDDPISDWTATLAVRHVGTDGHNITMTVYTCQGTGVEVHDDRYFDGTNWNDYSTNVGIRVGVDATIAELERAINDGSRYIEVSVADSDPTKVVENTTSAHESIVFAGATDTAPTTEQLKLTGLSFEIGLKPGVYKRLPSSQTQ